MILPTHRLVRRADAARRPPRSRPARRDASRSSRCRRDAAARGRHRRRAARTARLRLRAEAATARACLQYLAADAPRPRRRAPARRDPRADARRRRTARSRSPTTTPRRSPRSLGPRGGGVPAEPAVDRRGAHGLPGGRADAREVDLLLPEARQRLRVRPGRSALDVEETSRGDAPPDESRRRGDPRSLLSRARPRLRRAGRLHGLRRGRRARRARVVRLRHAAHEPDARAHPLPPSAPAHHAVRDGGAQVPLRDADLRRPAVDPAPDRVGQRVLGTLLV